MLQLNNKQGSTYCKLSAIKRLLLNDRWLASCKGPSITTVTTKTEKAKKKKKKKPQLTSRKCMSNIHVLTYPYWSVTCGYLTYFHDVLLQRYKLFFFSVGSNLPGRTAENCRYPYLLISQIVFGDMGISAAYVPFALSS